jgi:ABC-type amino acid transport substrate-binding protein
MHGRGLRTSRSSLVGLLLGSVLGASALAADLPEIQARGRLHVLVVPWNAPDEFFTTMPSPGDRPGLDREVLQDFCQLYGLRLDVVPVDAWDGLATSLAAGRGDLAAGRFTITEARRQLIDFTVPVFPTRVVVVTRTPRRRVTSLAELRALRVGTVKGTSLADALVAAGVPAEHIDDGIATGQLAAALRAGRVAAVALGVESFISEQRKDARLEAGLFLGAPGALAYGVRRGNHALRAALDAHIRALKASPRWPRLLSKYFGESAFALLQRAQRAE